MTTPLNPQIIKSVVRHVIDALQVQIKLSIRAKCPVTTVLHFVEIIKRFYNFRGQSNNHRAALALSNRAKRYGKKNVIGIKILLWMLRDRVHFFKSII